MKTAWWNHFKNNKKLWGNGFTMRRLGTAEQVILADVGLWEDVLSRHGGESMTPEQMMLKKPEIYQHCVGNMTGIIMHILLENKIVKP